MEGCVWEKESGEADSALMTGKFQSLRWSLHCLFSVVCSSLVPSLMPLTLLAFSSDLFCLSPLKILCSLLITQCKHSSGSISPFFSFNEVFFEVYSCIYGINPGLLSKGLPTPTFQYFYFNLGPRFELTVQFLLGMSPCLMFCAVWNNLYSNFWNLPLPLLGIEPSTLCMAHTPSSPSSVFGGGEVPSFGCLLVCLCLCFWTLTVGVLNLWSSCSSFPSSLDCRPFPLGPNP